jgi:uncharacterized protein (TIGR02600 family)
MALVVVLCFLVLLTVVMLSFFTSVTTESNAAHSGAAASTAKLLADSAVDLASAQITDATKALPDASRTIRTWASQPGMIHTFDSSGRPGLVYKLYSDSQMVGSAPAAVTPIPATWNTNATLLHLYTDLNQPAVDRNRRLVYPILDPAALGTVEGLSLTAPPGFNAARPESPVNNRAPMPVKWLYLLKDGKIVPGDRMNGTEVEVPSATAANPIVGRIAFWADDETAKVNINTASEGVFWDMPRAFSMEDFGKYDGTSNRILTPGLAICQPAQREFQRYPGHPATTCLSPIFGSALPIPAVLTASNAGDVDRYYSLAPRVKEGGSASGTKAPTAAITPDSDRLYASIDELMFTPSLNGNARIVNTPGASNTQPGAISRDVLERSKFFITANSNAPETTLFNTPRVAVWPVHTNASQRTAYDKLLAFCSTIREGGANRFYHFTRANSRSGTADYTGRNVEIYEYLRALTSAPIPGYGGTFEGKYTQLERDQILTFIYDYIRCTNLQDQNTGATPFTPIFVHSGSGPQGAGEVVPIRIIPNGTGTPTQGFGRFYSVTQAALNFYATEANSTNQTTKMRAALLLEFSTPMNGLACMRGKLKYTVRGLENLQMGFGPVAPPGYVPLNFRVDPATGANGTNFMDWYDIASFAGRSVGGTEAPTQALMTSTGGPKPFADADAGGSAPNKYPFFSASDVPVPPAQTQFWFTSGNREIRVEIRESGAAPDSPPIQTLRMIFPNGRFKIPAFDSNAAYTVTTGSGASQIKKHLFGNRSFGAAPSQAVLSVDTVVAMEVGGTLGNANDATIDPSAGDVRMTEGLVDVPASRFRPNPRYSTPGIQFAHRFTYGYGPCWVPFPSATFGRLIPGASYNTRDPAVSDRVGNAVRRAANSGGNPGDWDTGFGDQPDGAYINKPDEGDTKLDDIWRGYFRVPYFLGAHQGFSSASPVYFSPNRQIPSPLMLGSIPTGVQRFLPWQTLLFHPRPEDATHPGKISPPDHLLADLFWMPVVEPYAISQPFSTAGKINMNYGIQPFSYIRRDTGLRAVMKATKFMALNTADAARYKPHEGFRLPDGSRIPNARYAIDPDKTLAPFNAKFAARTVFKSASEICEINLVPSGTTFTAANMASFWNTKPLTGDNLREKPYVDLYPRLTTKSNTFTVHFRVQVIQQSAATRPNVWDPKRDQISSEYRGSSILERYIDLNDPTLPDFARLATVSLTDPRLNIDQYYKTRIVSTRRFAP